MSGLMISQSKEGASSLDFRLGARILVISELHQLGLTVLKIFEILNDIFKIGRLPDLDIQSMMDLYAETKLQCVLLIQLGDEIRDLLGGNIQFIEEKMDESMTYQRDDLREIVRFSADFSESIVVVSDEVRKEMRYFDYLSMGRRVHAIQIDGLRLHVCQTVESISLAMDDLHRMLHELKRSIASDFNIAYGVDIGLTHQTTAALSRSGLNGVNGR